MNRVLLREVINVMNQLSEWHASVYGPDYTLNDTWNEFRTLWTKLLDELEKEKASGS